MPGVARIVPPDLESPFHAYDRALRQNLALRRARESSGLSAASAPSGAPLAAVTEENARMRAAIEKAGLPVPRVSEGAVQPTALIDPPRWHIPADDPKVCPTCGERSAGRVCRCGHILADGPAPTPGWWYRHVAGGVRARTTLPDPRSPFRPEVRWDRLLAWTLGIPAFLVGILWFLQPALQ